ncbi:MAG: alanine:cation symporter family protein, partial [Candidatus Dadabacteria bacterium]
PFVVSVLFLGAVFFTFWYRWINIRGFKHSLEIIMGRYDREEDKGEISHFKALTSALSATVGLGNIAGVAIAIQAGGPGAVLWMIIAAVFGMSAKFSSCTLSQLYRKENPDGSISGGPMYYLDIGLRQFGKGVGAFGKLLGVIFAVMVMGGSIGGGNMFQANQTVEALKTTFRLGSGSEWVIGIVMAFFVAIVVLGGIKRIGAATSKIVPFMCGLYVLASLFVIFANADKIPETLALIWKMAFTDNAFFGGMVGVAVMGIRRAAFSNEAGLGSAAIAHAAAKTDEPVREGLVAMIGPFIDTIIICLMTSLVVVITGAWNMPELTSQGANIGVSITSEAFRTVLPWFPYVLAVCVCLFAYSTMISWCYYGERGWIYLMDHVGYGKGIKTVVIFRILFVVAVVVGAVNSLSDVIDFTDAMILSMAFPNIIGSVILAPKVLKKVDDYWSRYKAGAF